MRVYHGKTKIRAGSIPGKSVVIEMHGDFRVPNKLRQEGNVSWTIEAQQTEEVFNGVTVKGAKGNVIYVEYESTKATHDRTEITRWIELAVYRYFEGILSFPIYDMQRPHRWLARTLLARASSIEVTP